ncbi:MAG: AI-2E family transporter [Casimicrobiaceae bacterium]
MNHAVRDPRWTLAAIVTVAFALGAVLLLHLTIALVAAMVVYTGGRRATEWMQRRTRLPHPELLSVAILILVIVVVTSEVVERATEAAASSAGYKALVEQMVVTLDQLQRTLPPWLAAHVPVSFEELRTAFTAWLRAHGGEVRLWGQHTVRATVYLLAGVVIGALAFIQTRPATRGHPAPTAWMSALSERFALFEQSFGAVVFAQLRIAVVNTILTGLYVLVLLPLLGAPLPLALTIVAFTFFASLIPVVGNLASNSVIVIVSLAQGLWIAVLSLGYLVAIHKLEYLLNAHIVGTRIGTKAFELLAVMLVFEAMFGLAGLVMAPILYAYAKAEMRAVGWL